MTQIFEEWLDDNKLTHNTHQKLAVEWCLKREMVEEGIKGGIIADEMGLGKTIEMLGTIYSNHLPNTLIVLPYSLLGQWCNIITALFHLKPLIYHGSNRKRLTEEQIRQHPIVLTTYGLISERQNILEEEVNQSPLYNIQWNRVIYDEAHHLRNKKTAVYAGALRLRTEITWLMTGTPVQNSEQDLYNLYSILGFRTTAFIMTNIEALVREFMLRRTKEEAGIILPACHSTVVEVPWKYTKEQKLAKIIHAKLSFSNLTEDTTSIATTTGATTTGVKSEHFKLLSKAKKICVLPKLLNTHTRKYRFVIKEDHEEVDHHVEAVPITNSVDLCNRSSKMDSVIKAILERKYNGKPKLVFCYFHKEIDELADALTRQALYVKKIDGRTSKKEREQILLEPAEVLIGQIDATNEGLNLQAYKEIYIVSPQWNPAVEDQAIARCHRLGQTEEVNVFHFVMTGFTTEEQDSAAITLDQHICNVQEKKRNIIQKMLARDF